jgi:phenylpropionate dioxygenase-like ring-hydroxylating dioxygenase large terminal subunit
MTQPELNGWRSGHGLPGTVYRDAALYEQEIQRIFFRAWTYVGHQSQIPQRGDYFLFEIAGESLIIARAADRQINAMLNVCRHRGSRLCDRATGHEARFVCRYHGWTYGLDGTLRAASQTPEGFDRSQHGLRRVQCRVFAGLIFINFDAEAAPIEVLTELMAAPLAPYQLERCKVAHRQNYPIASNWKLAVENYCECYHCAPAHPEYSVGHGRAIPRPEYESLLQEVMARAPAAGLTQHHVRRMWLDAPAFGADCSFERYPLLRGHRTGSRDGSPLAPLLGTLSGYDGGATDFQLGPTTFGLAYCDHVVLYRFTPRTLCTTDCEITWLVNESAAEGRDYDREQLIWLWHVTTLADKEIIERNSAGVGSRFYVPGPLSPMEDFANHFLRWYVATMSNDPKRVVTLRSGESHG